MEQQNIPTIPTQLEVNARIFKKKKYMKPYLFRKSSNRPPPIWLKEEMEEYFSDVQRLRRVKEETRDLKYVSPEIKATSEREEQTLFTAIVKNEFNTEEPNTVTPQSIPEEYTTLLNAEESRLPISTLTEKCYEELKLPTPMSETYDDTTVSSAEKAKLSLDKIGLVVPSIRSEFATHTSFNAVETDHSASNQDVNEIDPTLLISPVDQLEYITLPIANSFIASPFMTENVQESEQIFTPINVTELYPAVTPTNQDQFIFISNNESSGLVVLMPEIDYCVTPFSLIKSSPFTNSAFNESTTSLAHAEQSNVAFIMPPTTGVVTYNNETESSINDEPDMEMVANAPFSTSNTNSDDILDEAVASIDLLNEGQGNFAFPSVIIDEHDIPLTFEELQPSSSSSLENQWTTTLINDKSKPSVSMSDTDEYITPSCSKHRKRSTYLKMKGVHVKRSKSSIPRSCKKKFVTPCDKQLASPSANECIDSPAKTTSKRRLRRSFKAAVIEKKSKSSDVESSSSSIEESMPSTSSASNEENPDADESITLDPLNSRLSKRFVAKFKGKDASLFNIHSIAFEMEIPQQSTRSLSRKEPIKIRNVILRRKKHTVSSNKNLDKPSEQKQNVIDFVYKRKRNCSNFNNGIKPDGEMQASTPDTTPVTNQADAPNEDNNATNCNRKRKRYGRGKPSQRKRKAKSH